MLSVQQSINQTSFGQSVQRRALTPEERQMIAEQQEMQRERNEILRQQYEFEMMANDKNSPDAMKKLAKAGAILTAGAAVGLTAGGGAKITISKLRQFNKSNFMKKAREYGSSFKQFISESWKSIKAHFKKSDVYKKPAEYAEKKYNKFAEKDFGKKVIKFFGTIKNMAKAGFDKIKEGKNYVVNKIKSVKADTYENATAATVGGSSAICASVNSMKKQEAGEQ